MAKRRKCRGKPIRYVSSPTSGLTGYLGTSQSWISSTMVLAHPLSLEEQTPHLLQLRPTHAQDNPVPIRAPMKGHMDYFWEGHYTRDHTHKSYKNNYRPWRSARRGYRFYRWLNNIRRTS